MFKDDPHVVENLKGSILACCVFFWIYVYRCVLMFTFLTLSES